MVQVAWSSLDATVVGELEEVRKEFLHFNKERFSNILKKNEAIRSKNWGHSKTA